MSEFENIGDFSGSGTITSLNSSVIASTNGCSSVIFNITGTWNASLIIQAQNGDGNWFTTQGLIEPSSVLVEATSVNNVILINCGGFSQVRLIATSYTSGTATISWNSGNGNNAVWVYNPVASNLNATVIVSGTPTINVTNSSGSGAVNIQDGGNTLTVDGTVNSIDSVYKPATLGITTTGTSGSAVTLTLPAIASNFHYITLVEIVKYATAAITGTATPTLVTTTNLSGNSVFTFGTAQAIGTVLEYLYSPCLPVKSSVANTATTIVCPATTNVIWRVNAFYYVGV